MSDDPETQVPEQLMRDVIGGLQGVYFDKDFDPRTVNITDLLRGAFPEGHPFALNRRIYPVTEGPGEHFIDVEPLGLPANRSRRLQVPDGEVFATINNMSGTHGSLTTYMLTRVDEHTLRYTDQETHIQA